MLTQQDQETVKQINDMVDYLNELANSQPNRQVPHNHPGIWANIGHKYSNDDYWRIFEAIDTIYPACKASFKPSELKQITTAVQVLEECHQEHPRLFDVHHKHIYKGRLANEFNKPKTYKSIAWGALMAIRDVHNRITGWKPAGYGTTQTVKKQAIGGSVNRFNNLFDLPTTEVRV